VRPTAHLVPVRGIDLRYAVLLVLHRRSGRTLSVAEILDDLADRGVWPGGPRAGKAVADAMRWEVRRGRIERVDLGHYRLGRLPDTTRRRAQDCLRALVAVTTAAADDGDEEGGRIWVERW